MIQEKAGNLNIIIIYLNSIFLFVSSPTSSTVFLLSFRLQLLLSRISKLCDEFPNFYRLFNLSHVLTTFFRRKVSLFVIIILLRCTMAINVPPEFTWPSSVIPKPVMRTSKDSNKTSSVSLGKLIERGIDSIKLPVKITNTTALSNQLLTTMGSVIAGNSVFGEHLSFRSYNELMNSTDRPTFLKAYNDCINNFVDREPIAKASVGYWIARTAFVNKLASEKNSRKQRLRKEAKKASTDSHEKSPRDRTQPNSGPPTPSEPHPSISHEHLSAEASIMDSPEIRPSTMRGADNLSGTRRTVKPLNRTKSPEVSSDEEDVVNQSRSRRRAGPPARYRKENSPLTNKNKVNEIPFKRVRGGGSSSNNSFESDEDIRNMRARLSLMVDKKRKAAEIAASSGANKKNKKRKVSSGDKSDEE